MKKILFFVVFLAIGNFVNGQTKLFGGLAYSNIGPKAQIGITEFFEEGGFLIKTTGGYSYEFSYDSESYDGHTTQIKRQHLELSSVILFDVKKFDIGGGFSYRYFLPMSAGTVGLKLTTLYHVNDKYNIEASYNKTVSGENFISLGVNLNIL